INPLQNVVTVSPANGDFTSPIAAINSIDDAGPTNPYLVVIGPGIYDLGNSQLVMKDHVSVTGSGQDVTILRGSVSSDTFDENSALLVGANSASIRDLTLDNTQTNGSFAFGFYTEDAASDVSNVTILVSDSTSAVFAVGIIGLNDDGLVMNLDRVTISTTTTVSSPVVHRGIYNFASTTVLRNSHIILDNAITSKTGIFNLGILTVSDSTIEVSGSTINNDGIINSGNSFFSRVDSSRISASSRSIEAGIGAGPTESFISDSVLDGSITGDPKCSFTFNAVGTALDEDCLIPAQ
ncbi:MAG: hypothetical protein AAF197_12080, partial [Pseudomonadota bacterium]